jgi:hypothetical protein
LLKPVVLGALCAVLLNACAGNGSKHEPVDTSLLALNPAKAPEATSLPSAADLEGGDVGSLTAQAAVDLQKILDSGVLDRAAKHPETASEPDKPTTPVEQAGPPAPTPDTTSPKTDATTATDDPLLELAKRMAALLRGEKTVPDAVALAPIEAMQPGVLADLEMPGSALGGKLSVEDRRALTDARDRILAQPGAANEGLVRTLARLAPPAALKISRSVLCTKVDGFGRYVPFNTDTFIVGRPLRAIVYIELDGFMARPACEGDPVQPGLSLGEQASVELSQSLTLYHDPSGLQAWRCPAKTAIETSRNKRKDFYLIQTIELPATLTVGRYNLKVTVKDKSSGGEAEAVLPVNVVADASAVVQR